MIDIVIPYMKGPDNGFELRYALRSIAKNFKLPYRVWLMGEKPSWCIRVQHVHVDRPEQKPFRAFSDTTNKLKTALEMPGMGRKIMYMYDDIYFTQPTYKIPQTYYLQNQADIEPSKWFAKSKAGERWIQLSMKTFLTLKHHKKSLFNCETHLPRIYDRAKLHRLMTQFEMVESPMQIASFYYNWYGANFNVMDDSVKFGVYKHMSIEEIVEGAKKAQFMNHSAMQFNTRMKDALAQLFPKKSPHEK